MSMYTVCVVGSGAREHAFCWILARSPQVKRIIAVPGNPGMRQFAQCFPKPSSFVAWRELMKAEGVDLCVIGPEQPLAEGLADELIGVPVVGPSREAARLEASKAFAKEVMAEGRVPTAAAVVTHSLTEGERYLAQYGEHRCPVVLKADGLAAGKGVIVTDSLQAARESLPLVWEVPGTTRVLIEERLIGSEVSLIAACNGTEAVLLPPAHDFKRIFEQDEGPNTGGMGTVAPSPRCSEEESTRLMDEVITPVLRAMRDRGAPFKGFLYAGLMKLSDGSFRVLEYNVRCGDPETQGILPLIEGDIIPLLVAMARGESLPPVRVAPRCAVGVTLASAGYPEAPELGDVIEGVEFAQSIPGALVFHAGTGRNEKGQLVTAGGRVLTVVGVGASSEEARRTAYRAADMIQFRGRQLRRDIA